MEDDRLLLELRAAGRSTVSIGVALKRTQAAVTARIAHLRKHAEEATDVIRIPEK